MNDREAFEAQIKKQFPTVLDELLINRLSSGKYASMVTEHAWRSWQAATAAERERCAKACDAISEDKWALYKGRPPYTGRELGRASDYARGESDGAEQCADAIRKGE